MMRRLTCRRGRCTRGVIRSSRSWAEETAMAHISRRSVLRGSLALAAARSVGGPYVANAAATTASMGFSNPNEILQIYAWQDRWVDVSDVVETQRAQFSETALLASQAYNAVTKK